MLLLSASVALKIRLKLTIAAIVCSQLSEKQGKEQGEWIFFHANGKKWTQGEYKDGVQVGLWRMWNNAGDLLQEYYADNGPFKSWYPNGTMESKGEIVNGKREGEWSFYYINGQLFKISHYHADSINGKVIEYHYNGTKKFEGEYLDGKLNGYATWWFDNGDLEMEGNSVLDLQDESGSSIIPIILSVAGVPLKMDCSTEFGLTTTKMAESGKEGSTKMEKERESGKHGMKVENCNEEELSSTTLKRESGRNGIPMGSLKIAVSLNKERWIKPGLAIILMES